VSFRARFEHRDELLRCALDEFCLHGYGAASLNRILAASGMSKGQLYHHFAGKQGLYLALVEWMIDQKSAWFAEHPVVPGPDFLTTLGAQLRATLEFAAAHGGVERMSRAVLRERGQAIFDEVTRRFAFDSDSALAALVKDAHARGELRADLSPEFALRAVLLFVNHLPELLDLGRPAELAPRVEELLAFLKGGIARPPRSQTLRDQRASAPASSARRLRAPRK
jgi:AcrR family transcriptional regulator